MMKSLIMNLTLLLVAVSSIFSASGDITDGSKKFIMEISKIDESTFGFCTSDTVMTDSPAALQYGINFGLLENRETDIQTTTDFGVYWDLVYDTETNLSMSITFSGDENNGVDYMLGNADNSASVLNYNASGVLFENREGNGVAISDKIEVTNDVIDSINFTDRTIEIFSTSLRPYEEYYGSAKFNLVLNAPDGDPFISGEYKGYALLTLNAT